MIRQRLTLWNAFVLATLTTLMGCMVYWQIGITLANEQESELIRRSNIFSGIASSLPDPRQLRIGPKGGVPELANLSPEQVATIQLELLGPRVFFKDGQSIPLEWKKNSLDEQAVHEALNGKSIWSSPTVELSGTRSRLRVYTFPVHLQGGEVAAIQLGASQEKDIAYLEKLKSMLIVIVPLTWVIAIFAGMFLTNRAMRPLRDLNMAALKLDPTNPADRLPVNGKDEVSDLAETINSYLGGLNESYIRMENFSADASHELRTPLTSMLARVSQNRLEQKSPAELVEIIGSMKRSTESMAILVDDLLFFSREDTMTGLSRTEAVAVSEVLGTVCDHFVPEVGDRLSLKLAGRLEMNGEPRMLERLFLNLVGNAVKHGGPDAEILVSGTLSGKEIEVVIADNGPGILLEQRDLIFDRFYQCDTSRTKSGSGLGLAIVKKIVELHNGSIQVRSSPGNGFQVRVLLPTNS